MDTVREEHGALKRLAPLVGAALFFAALAVLHRELRDVHYHELTAAVADRLPARRDVYNLQGLRAFKEKFHPVWEPRYLAYPGGLSLPGVMADVSALVAGGYTRIFR